MANQHDNAMCFAGAAVPHAQEAYCQAKQYMTIQHASGCCIYYPFAGACTFQGMYGWLR